MYEFYGMRLIVSLCLQDRLFIRVQGNFKKQGEIFFVLFRFVISMVIEGDVIVFKGKSKILFRFIVFIVWLQREILLLFKL